MMFKPEQIVESIDKKMEMDNEYVGKSLFYVANKCYELGRRDTIEEVCKWLGSQTPPPIPITTIEKLRKELSELKF